MLSKAFSFPCFSASVRCYSKKAEVPHVPNPAPYNGPPKETVKRQRRDHLNRGLAILYKEPIQLVQGKGQYLWDESGKQYLDCFAGVATVSVGHAHEKINQAAFEQMGKIGHSTPLYLNEQMTQYAEELAARLPPHLSVCHFVNSGSEANDLAITMARLYTGKYDVIALRNAYHGDSPFTMGVTAHHTWKFQVPQGFGIHHALNPDRFRGPYKYDDPEAGEKYAWDVKNLIEHGTTGNPAAFICEPIQGVGGIFEYPEGYLQKVYGYVRAAGGVVIADEVQTGFGRTGSNYWGFQNHGVSPDIVTMAKGIGNGWPLACVVTTPEIAAVMTRKANFNTFGGNPVAAAVGRAVLRAIDEEGIQENARVNGGLLKKGLLALCEKYPTLLKDARGQGFMLGVEVVVPGTATDPNAPAATQILEVAREQGLLIGKGGLYGNVLRIQPVMCLNEHDVKFTLAALDHAAYTVLNQ